MSSRRVCLDSVEVSLFGWLEVYVGKRSRIGVFFFGKFIGFRSCFIGIVLLGCF